MMRVYKILYLKINLFTKEFLRFFSVNTGSETFLSEKIVTGFLRF